MRLWRLSGMRHAHSFDGGYGIAFDGRWNTNGHAVTYCATSPSLCVLEKLVHVEDPRLLPDLVMLAYEVPEPTSVQTIPLEDLPPDWRRRESLTQSRGDAWHGARAALLLKAPSAIVALAGSPDWNVVINHDHPGAKAIRLAGATPFALDARLL